MADEDTTTKPTEEEKVWRWRFDQFHDVLRFPASMAERLADDGADWQEADRLLKMGQTRGWVYEYLRES